ncbi:hypothetical protein EYF80_057921 [Liparis tanakae]|uniref:Uncharacterized protein n=1 Tax=Liparis tanakae TaxID=230148 RepID=A0A4Z2ET03_9TELE|nr:hypothetical protein EYF80_057921 [Liparis tanakae]
MAPRRPDAESMMKPLHGRRARHGSVYGGPPAFRRDARHEGRRPAVDLNTRGTDETRQEPASCSCSARSVCHSLFLLGIDVLIRRGNHSGASREQRHRR